MCVNERQDTGSGTVKIQEEVAKVDDFKYLGSTVQRNGECGSEVKKRVQAGWNGWRRMSGVICDRRVPARVKGKVYKVAVRPAMLFGLETVALTKRQEAEMEVAELKMLRFSLGVTRMDKIRNEYIRGTAQGEKFGEKTREARLRWYGHLRRKDDGYIPSGYATGLSSSLSLILLYCIVIYPVYHLSWIVKYPVYHISLIVIILYPVGVSTMFPGTDVPRTYIPRYRCSPIFVL